MAVLIALAFIVVPLVELYVVIQVGSAIGVWNTIGLLVLMGVLGGWLMKHEGMGVFRRAQAALAAGRMPGDEVVDGFLILFGGALMLTPGFVTDLLGMALLLPPVRIALRRLIRRRLAARAARASGIIDL